MPVTPAKRRLRRLLRWGGAIAVVLIVAIGAGALWMGSKLVAPAPSAVGSPPGDLALEVVTIPSESGSTLAGWFGRAVNERGVIVLLHPNRGSRLSMLGRARLLLKHHYSVLLIDMQAHGESPGEHITAGWLERLDAKAAVAFAKERCPGKPVAALGISLGGAAILLASPLEVDAVIIESVYPTIDEAVTNRVRMRLGFVAPMFAELLLMQIEPRLGIPRSALRPIDHIADLGCPLLVIAGSADEHTTLAESRRMFDAAVEPKAMMVVEGAAHVDLLEVSPGMYEKKVIEFLNVHLNDARE
ncbi:MAG: alpha/beta hydrolase [Phycisphaeraceae bacterium]